MNSHAVSTIQLYLRSLESSFANQTLPDVEKVERFTKFEKSISERIASLVQECLNACSIQTKWRSLVEHLHSHDAPRLNFSDLTSALHSMIQMLDPIRVQSGLLPSPPSTTRPDYALFREKEVMAILQHAHGKNVQKMLKTYPQLFKAADRLVSRVLDGFYGEQVHDLLVSGLLAQEQFLLLILLDGILCGTRLKKIEIFKHITSEEAKRVRAMKKTLTIEQVTHYLTQEIHQDELPLHAGLMQIIQRSFFKEQAAFATLVAYAKTPYAPSVEQLLYLLLKLDRLHLLDSIQALTDRRKYNELCCLHIIIVRPLDHPKRQKAKELLTSYAPPEVRMALYRVLELMCPDSPQQAVMLAHELFQDGVMISLIMETVARTRPELAIALLLNIDEQYRMLARLRIARLLVPNRPELIMTLAATAPKDEQRQLFSMAIAGRPARLQLVNFLPDALQPLFLAVYVAEVMANNVVVAITELRQRWALDTDFFAALAHHMGDRNDAKDIHSVLRVCREDDRSIVLLWYIYGLLKHDVPKSIRLIESMRDPEPLSYALFLLVQMAKTLRADDATTIATHLWRCPLQRRQRIIEIFIAKFSGTLPRQAFTMATSDALQAEHYLRCFFSATFDESQIFAVEDIRAVLDFIASYSENHFRAAIRIRDFFLKKLAYALFNSDLVGAARAINDIQDSICSYEAVERGILIMGAPNCFLLLKHLDRRHWKNFALVLDECTNHFQQLAFGRDGTIPLHEAALLAITLLNHQNDPAMAMHLFECLLVYQTLEEYFALLPLLDTVHHPAFFTAMRTMPQKIGSIVQHLQQYIDTYHDRPESIIATAMGLLVMTSSAHEIGQLIDRAAETRGGYLRELCVCHAMQQGNPETALFALEGITEPVHLGGALQAIAHHSQCDQAYVPLITRVLRVLPQCPPAVWDEVHANLALFFFAGNHDGCITIAQQIKSQQQLIEVLELTVIHLRTAQQLAFCRTLVESCHDQATKERIRLALLQKARAIVKE